MDPLGRRFEAHVFAVGSGAARHLETNTKDREMGADLVARLRTGNNSAD